MLWMAVIFFSFSLFGEPLQVTITHPLSSENILKNRPIEEEMILLPLSSSMNVSATIPPIFGTSPHTQVRYNGILMNDPSAPLGMANLRYVNAGAMTHEMGNRFDIFSTQKIPFSLEGSIGGKCSGMKTNFSLPTPFSPFFSQRSETIGEESLNALNTGLNHRFWLTPDTKFEFSLLKIKGDSTYYNAIKSTSLSHEERDQHGGRVKLITSDTLELEMIYSTIEGKYGSFWINGQTQELELTYPFLHTQKMGLHMLHEERSLSGGERDNRFIPDIFFKNEHGKIALSLWENQPYLNATVYGKHPLNPEQTLYFEGLFQKNPVKLSELLIAFEKDHQWMQKRSELMPESLWGARIAFEHKEKNDEYRFEIGSDYLTSPIFWDYQNYVYTNTQPWGKPFIKGGFSLKEGLKELHLYYKYTSPFFAKNPLQMMNIPEHLWSGKILFPQPFFTFTAKCDIMLGVKRYNETLKTAENNGYEGRLTLRMDFPLLDNKVIPFAECRFATLDDSFRNRNLMSIWVGIGMGLD